MDDLDLWTTKLRLHRSLEPLCDEHGGGIRQTTFVCPGESLRALCTYYETVAAEAEFRSIGRSFDLHAFCLTLEKDEILLSVSCVRDPVEASLLLTFMADHAKKRVSSPVPSGVMDGWTFCILPFEGSVADTYEEVGNSRTYRFVTRDVCPNAVAIYFRGVADQAGLAELDCVESQGAIALTFCGMALTLEMSAWADASMGPKGSVYSVQIRRDPP